VDWEAAGGTGGAVISDLTGVCVAWGCVTGRCGVGGGCVTGRCAVAGGSVAGGGVTRVVSGSVLVGAVARGLGTAASLTDSGVVV
jgi:hypothetical protein